MLRPPALLCLAAGVLLAVGQHLPAADGAGEEFFEKQVRPILVSRCFECHSAKSVKLQGGLRLDSRAGVLKGGETGPAIVPGKPKESLLVDAINYGALYQMPPKTKLPPDDIVVLTKWVEMGAPWPADPPVTAAGAVTKAFDLQKRQAEHWCWQPIQEPAVPAIPNAKSPIPNPVDAYILEKLQSRGLSPAPPADRHTLLRRVYFDLIGMPPSPAELEEFLSLAPSLLRSVSPSARDGAKEGQSDGEKERKAYVAVVDRLLDSPHFGERWARHWLDLVRYAESRGHEFDYNIPNAFEYRDYVIRALNADVPYDQFVIEHVAGDLLEKPRLHPTERFNESIVGTGFWFLGEWCHSPVDVRKDECDRQDNMLDVFSKTFLGLTVACARCHDHKFDAISQQDYYALAGFLQSSSYRLTRFGTWEQDRRIAAELAALDAKHRPLIAAAIAKALEPRIDELLKPLFERAANWGRDLGVPEVDLDGAEVIVDYSRPPAGAWMTDGPTWGSGPLKAGELVLTGEVARPLEVMPYGAACRDWNWGELRVAAPHEGDAGRLGGWVRAGRTLKTPTFTIDSGPVHYLIEGVGQVYAAVASHAMINGPLHGELQKETGGNSDLPTRWITHDLSRYAGHRCHLEFSPKEGEDFRVLMVVQVRRPPAPVNRNSAIATALSDNPRQAAAATLKLLAADRIAAAEHPRDHAVFANWLIAAAKLDENSPPELEAAIAAYRADREKLIEQIQPAGRLCLAMWDGTPADEHLLIRGNHKTPGPAVPRRLLEAMASGGRQPPDAVTSGISSQEPARGRLELARQLVDPGNPLVSRVIVNRVWHHLFGRGIVPSVDNFGVLGQKPTHPELLDHLAGQFMQDGWSLKRLIRSIVLSETYRQSSGVRSRESAVDPENLLFHRQNLRRLEGESLRDAILAVSGRLDRQRFGPSVPVHLTPFMQGRGRPGESGPLDGAGRRSIYTAVRRNFLPPMMLAFDTPIPFSTIGRRNVSNVPAQALILMNDPFVAEQARHWARGLLAEKDATIEGRIKRMYLATFSREPDTAEIAAARGFLEQQGRDYGAIDERAWTDLAHVLFNVKEFVLVE
ncbi:MAG TPA: PSD1 and planctomycete cytochrome C domain-containing protein [Pirellulaceae bacterium]|nr:PSD1 and planctomycete cytochrome C domain-containing protein [Pirellulaceae bacterium]